MIADLLPTLRQADSPTVPTYTIRANGSPLPATMTVVSIITDTAVDRIPTATLTLADGDPSEQTFPASESPELAPGAEIEIDLGYQGTDRMVFSGEVTGQRLKIRTEGSVLTVTVKHPVFRLTTQRVSRQGTDQSDNDFIEDILAEAGIEAEVAAAGSPHPVIVQHLCTDWDFIITRAQVNGWVTYVREGKLKILKPAIADPVATLESGINLFSFDGELDIRRHHAEYETRAWSTADLAATTEEAGASLEPDLNAYGRDNQAGAHRVSPGRTVLGAPVEATELIDRANAAQSRSALGRIAGLAEVEGTALISVGDTVELAGLGQVFNGKALVTGVRHDVSDSGWVTFLQLGLSAEWFTEQHDVNAPAAGGVIPAVSGLQYGKVLQIGGDPAGEERLLVSIPAIDPNGEGVWARLATLTAGSDHGMTFRPHIDQEVILGFMHDDPRFPVVLGAVHGGTNTSQIEATDDNEKSGFRTPGGAELLFDNSKDTISLKTAAGDSIILDGEEGTIELRDQNGNAIVLSSDGIDIKGAKDVRIESAVNTEVSAGAGAMISGTSQLEVSSSAVTTIKGSLVQIN